MHIVVVNIFNVLLFVSPAKQKRDICTAFPASSLSSSLSTAFPASSLSSSLSSCSQSAA